MISLPASLSHATIVACIKRSPIAFLLPSRTALEFAPKKTNSKRLTLLPTKGKKTPTREKASLPLSSGQVFSEAEAAHCRQASYRLDCTSFRWHLITFVLLSNSPPHVSSATPSDCLALQTLKLERLLLAGHCPGSKEPPRSHFNLYL